MCEGVGEDSRHGACHVDIRIGMCKILLECVCYPLQEHLGGVTHVGKFIYWALLTPWWENNFRYRRYTEGRNASRTSVLKKRPDMVLFLYCVKFWVEKPNFCTL